MKRPLRCTLMIHKWIVKQDSPDGPRYAGCARCDAIKMVDTRLEAFTTEFGHSFLADDDPHEKNR